MQWFRLALRPQQLPRPTETVDFFLVNTEIKSATQPPREFFITIGGIFFLQNEDNPLRNWSIRNFLSGRGEVVAGGHGAVSKGMSAVMPFLKCAPFTLRSGGSRSLSSSFLGVKWEKILGLKPFETTPFFPDFRGSVRDAGCVDAKHNRSLGLIAEPGTHFAPDGPGLPTSRPIDIMRRRMAPFFSQRILQHRDLQIAFDNQALQLSIFFD